MLRMIIRGQMLKIMSMKWSRTKREPATVARATFELEGEDIQPIEEVFGTGALKRPELTLSKGYENKQYIGLTINEKVIISALLHQAQLPDDLTKQLSTCATLEALKEATQANKSEENQEHIERLEVKLKEIDKAVA